MRGMWRSHAVVSTVLAITAGRRCIAVGPWMHDRWLRLVGCILWHTASPWRLRRIRLAPRHVWRLGVQVLRMLIHIAAVGVVGGGVLLAVLLRV